MKLSAYIARQGLNPTQAAAEIGISQGALSRFLNGRRGFSAAAIGKIEQWSRGKVTLQDILDETRTEPA
jgi:DNA transposition AAA+ family ATPase